MRGGGCHACYAAWSPDGSLFGIAGTPSVAKPRVLVPLPGGEELPEQVRTGELLRTEDGERVAWVRQMCRPVLIFELGEGHERLIRTCARAPFALERIELMKDGRIAHQLKRAPSATRDSPLSKRLQGRKRYGVLCSIGLSEFGERK